MSNNTNQTTTPSRRHKTTYAERLAARKAKRTRPVHVNTVRATQRRCAAAAIKTKRVFAESFAGAIVPVSPNPLE